jgi:hypothetical protein
MSASGPTTQLSEYAQRQLPEGIIDFAAGQVGQACVGGLVGVATTLEGSRMVDCLCVSLTLSCLQPGPSLLPLSHIAAAAADRLTGPKADPFILQ